MRFLAMAFGLVLGAVLFLADGRGTVRADSPACGDAVPALAAPDAGGPVAAQPGTDEESREYRQREAESPEVQEFVGGDGGFVFAVLVLAALVLLFLYLKKEGKI